MSLADLWTRRLYESRLDEGFPTYPLVKDSELSFLLRVISLCITFLSKMLACNVDVSSDSHANLAREA